VPKENDEEAARVYVHTHTQKIFFYSVSRSRFLSCSFIIHTHSHLYYRIAIDVWYRYVLKLNITFRQKLIKIKKGKFSHGWQRYFLSFVYYDRNNNLCKSHGLIFFSPFVWKRNRRMQKAENLYTLVNLFLFLFCNARWVFYFV
jgi:hypothetical protein